MAGVDDILKIAQNPLIKNTLGNIPGVGTLLNLGSMIGGIGKSGRDDERVKKVQEAAQRAANGDREALKWLQDATGPNSQHPGATRHAARRALNAMGQPDGWMLAQGKTGAAPIDSPNDDLGDLARDVGSTVFGAGTGAVNAAGSIFGGGDLGNLFGAASLAALLGKATGHDLMGKLTETDSTPDDIDPLRSDLIKQILAGKGGLIDKIGGSSVDPAAGLSEADIARLGGATLDQNTLASLMGRGLDPAILQQLVGQRPNPVDLNRLGTQSLDQIGTGQFAENTLRAYSDLFGVNRERALAQAKESVGNLTGSGLDNAMTSVLRQTLADENATLASVLQNLTQAEAGRQGQDASRLLQGMGISGQFGDTQLNRLLQTGTVQAELEQANLNRLLQALGLNVQSSNTGTDRLLQALLSNVNTGQFNTGLQFQGGQNDASRFLSLIQGMAQTGVGTPQTVYQPGLLDSIISAMGPLAGILGARAGRTTGTTTTGGGTQANLLETLIKSGAADILGLDVGKTGAPNATPAVLKLSDLGITDGQAPKTLQDLTNTPFFKPTKPGGELSLLPGVGRNLGDVFKGVGGTKGFLGGPFGSFGLNAPPRMNFGSLDMAPTITPIATADGPAISLRRQVAPIF